jgi:hypothetical protein
VSPSFTCDRCLLANTRCFCLGGPWAPGGMSPMRRHAAPRAPEQSVRQPSRARSAGLRSAGVAATTRLRRGELSSNSNDRQLPGRGLSFGPYGLARSSSRSPHRAPPPVLPRAWASQSVRKADAPPTFAKPAIVRRKPPRPERSGTPAVAAPEPALSEDYYEHILFVIRAAGKAMERSP